MSASNIKLLSQYYTQPLSPDTYQYDIEKDWIDRPAWIKLLNPQQELPRFLSIQVPKFGELIYKSFRDYYYPIDYTNDEERRFMNGMAKDYDEMVAQIHNIPMAKSLLEEMDIMQFNKNSHILDLGCGTGIISDLLAQHGFKHFTLADFSSGMLDQAKYKLKSIPDISFHNLDLRNTLPEGSFDIVVSIMLFNTFNDEVTEQIISRLDKQLNPNATFAVLEDTSKKAYSKYFNTQFEGMVDTGDRTKYIFVGKKK